VRWIDSLRKDEDSSDDARCPPNSFAHYVGK
jgi:hypothetical protein